MTLYIIKIRSTKMVNEIIKKRRSIRKFDPNGVITDEQIKTLLEAAMLAPSAVNSRPWDFFVVKNCAKMVAMVDYHPYAKMLQTASVAIIMTANPRALDGTKIHGAEMWQHDCGAATQNILLQAMDMGFGSCWCGIHPNEDRMQGFRQMFDISNDRVPFCVIAIGIAAEGEVFGSRGFYDEKKVRWIE